VITGDPANNVPENIYEKMAEKLHTRADHPLCIIKEAIHGYFDTRFGAGVFSKLDNLPALVSTAQNFDQVLVPPDHVSRSPNDTYYVNASTVLRCHTSAHQVDTLRAGHSAFLITGDVYRRDAIDATHYPVFHQMEGVRVFTPADWGTADPTTFAAAELKDALAAAGCVSLPGPNHVLLPTCAAQPPPPTRCRRARRAAAQQWRYAAPRRAPHRAASRAGAHQAVAPHALLPRAALPPPRRPAPRHGRPRQA
jgi:hypothetical protein